jgi:murein DD-endopeptidase MepM/ murein hydrolase activator NlpD
MDTIGRWIRKIGGACARIAQRARPVMRALWDRFGYAASLVVLLFLVGAAAYAYRSRPAEIARVAPTSTPEPAVLSSYALDADADEPEEEQVAFLAPVFGEIVGEYAVDELHWSDTLKQWQTHPGIDIAAPLGTAVFASADGTVKDAYRDPLFGNVVVIEHDGGYETLYAGLQTMKLAEPGAEVKAGDVIGAVGNSADLEVELGAHLHFEMLHDGEHIEPLIDWEGAAAE